MPTIGVIDDRKTSRDTISRTIKVLIEGTSWRCLARAPFDKVNSYLTWIRDNDIAVIAIDWVLNETAEVRHPVDYKADAVIKAIRKSEPTFPIFAVTAFDKDSALKKHVGDVEDILCRDDFTKTPDMYVQRIMRAGDRFITNRQKELNELASLSAKSALGSISTTERKRLRAIQESLSLSSPDKADDDRGASLKELQDVLKDAATLAEEFKTLLTRKEGANP